jgi:hypothetical protein
MWVVLLTSLVLGAACRVARLKVWALIPITFVFSTIIATSSFLSGLKWGTIALTVFAGATFLQLSYLADGLFFATARLRRVRAHLAIRRAELLRVMQSAIGQELRDHFQTPTDVPQNIRFVLAELELQNG